MGRGVISSFILQWQSMGSRGTVQWSPLITTTVKCNNENTVVTRHFSIQVFLSFLIFKNKPLLELVDNHLGNNEIFYPSWSQKFSPLAPPPCCQVPGRAHLVVAGNKEKQRKARPCAVCNPLSLLSSLSGSSAHGAVGVLAPHIGLVWRNPHHIASHADSHVMILTTRMLYEHINGAGAKIISLCFPL